MYSLLIKNALLIDGTGKKGSHKDVAVQGDEIVAIADNIQTSAQSVIDGSDLVLAPGFIDVQNHSDGYWQIFDNPGLDSLTTQGFTTILVGNCGASLAPLLSHEALASIQKWHPLEGLNVNWQSFSEFIEELSRRRFACNIATLVGYSTLRRGLVGDQIRGLEKSELASIKRALEDSLEAGAFGLSTGLSYAHEIIISEFELYELAKIVAKKGALLSVHLRSEGAEVLEAVDEALDIARASEINLKISHFKIRGKQNWNKYEGLMQHIDTAFHRGLNVHFDLYPYDTIWQVLYSYLPKWAYEGGRSLMFKHFNDPIQRRKILSFLSNSGVKFADLIVASTANKLNFSGKTIGQIAANMETSSEEAALNIIQNGGSEVMVFERNLSEEQVKDLSCHPLSFITTDGGGFSINTQDRLVHPRCFGTAPKFLKDTIATNSLPLEDAVFKLTGGPAAKLGLKRRGTIKVGNFADLVLFDTRTMSDAATYQNPYQYARGIAYVFVNGRPVVADGKLTGNLPGYALRRS